MAMLRINTHCRNGHRRIELEGAFRSHEISTLLDVLAETRLEGKSFVLDLAAVSYVDGAASECLRQLADAGVAMQRLSPFIRALVFQTGQPSSTPGQEVCDDTHHC